MAELDEPTRRALQLRTAPSAELEARVLDRLRVQLAGPPDGGSGSGSGSGSGGLAYAAKIVAATLGTTCAGLALVAVVGRTLVADRVGSDQDVPAEVAIDHRPPPHRERESSPQPIEAAKVEPQPHAITMKPSDRPASSPAATVEPGEPENRLQAELALLRAARAAKSPTDALVHLDRHRREFATGVLADEREALRIETLCELGRVDEAREAEQDFLAERPNSALRARVLEACP